MSTAVAVVPSRHQILDAIQAAAPHLTVFYPGDEFLVTEYCGILRWLTPDLGDEILPHPATGEDVVCNGETVIPARIGKLKTNGGYRNAVMEGAEEIVAFLTSSEGHGKYGVVALLGDDKKEHERVKREARRRYRQQRQAQAEREWSGRMDFVKRFQTDPRNQHRTPPPPNPRQQRAIEFLMARQEGMDGTRFASPDGAYQTDNWVNFKRYMKRMHGQDVRREDYPADEVSSVPGSSAVERRRDVLTADDDDVVSVSGSSQEAVLEAHSETPGARRPMPPKKTRRGRGRATHSRAAR